MIDWRVYGGVGIVTSAIAWLLFRTVDSAVIVPDETGRPDRWVSLEGDQIKLFTADRYRACISVPFFIPTSAVANAIPGKAADMGFRDVVVHRSLPAGWSSGAVSGCDLYVEGTWTGADGVAIDRPSQLRGAWRQARA